MVFIKNDPKTREAGAKGGKSGDKHFTLMPKKKLSQVGRQAGRLSGEARRRKRDVERGRMTKTAYKIEHRIMHDYLD